VTARRPILIVIMVLALAARARADDDAPQIQHMQLAESGAYLTLSTEKLGGLGKLFDPAAYEALATGIKKTVLIKLQITPQGSDKPIAEQVIQIQALYDVWNENYKVQIDSLGGSTKLIAKSHSDALVAVTELHDIPIARLTQIPTEQVFVLKIVAELNPVSDEILAEVRRWLSQGNGGGLDRGGALFGSFVSVFYNPKLARADRVLRLQSQPFYRLPL
jgi:hypothetical protein